MILGDILSCMVSWGRIKISTEKQVDAKGNRIFSDTLTEAQKFAYWHREVVAHTIDASDPLAMTVLCVLKEDLIEEQQQETE